MWGFEGRNDFPPFSYGGLVLLTPKQVQTADTTALLSFSGLLHNCHNFVGNATIFTLSDDHGAQHLFLKYLKHLFHMHKHNKSSYMEFTNKRSFISKRYRILPVIYLLLQLTSKARNALLRFAAYLTL